MELFNGIEVLTFDCYGTLIDWEKGLLQALSPLNEHHDVRIDDDKLLEVYGILESAEECGEYQNYKAVLRAVVRGLGRKFGFTPSDTEVETLVGSIGKWPPFPDTVEALRALKTKYKLAIISNTDDDLFAETQKRLGVSFDHVITAEQAKSYKPSPINFKLAVERINVSPEHILHVAQSLYHDIPPAKFMGMRTVWVDRRYKKSGPGATPPAEAMADLAVPSLRALAKLLHVL